VVGKSSSVAAPSISAAAALTSASVAARSPRARARPQNHVVCRRTFRLRGRDDERIAADAIDHVEHPGSIDRPRACDESRAFAAPGNTSTTGFDGGVADTPAVCSLDRGIDAVRSVAPAKVRA
jgi:hypothetical protein